MQRLYPPRMSKRPLSNPGRDQAAVASAAVSPTASAYFRNVSTDEQTTLASIAKSSIPTSDTLAHASMTIPLSRIRSITSTRLEDAIVFSTAITLTSFHQHFYPVFQGKPILSFYSKPLKQPLSAF